MITGTSHFYNKEAAYFYYRAYGFDKKAVDAKLARQEIHIGRPTVKEGERVHLNEKEMRYFIESKG